MECCQVPPNPPLLQPSSQDNCSSPSQPGGSLLSSLLINAYQCPSCTVGPKTTRSIAGMAQQAPSRSKQPPPSTHWLQKIHDELTFPAARTLLPCQLVPPGPLQQSCPPGSHSPPCAAARGWSACPRYSKYISV